jgi:hypothetical protein
VEEKWATCTVEDLLICHQYSVVGHILIRLSYDLLTA